MTNVILCGGSGTRLWPLSRTLMPKQFIRLFNAKSLFDLTLRRNVHAQKTIIVCNEAHYFLALDECGGKKIDKFILEPFGKNTAAAITFAALCCDEDEILLITPSDHLIEDEAEYKKALLIAQSYANQDFLVTFGIKPSEPNTGYGYIKADKNGDVERFIEKPNLETAVKFIKEGEYYFNSGMFCFKAGVFLNEMKKYAPSIVKDVTAAIEGSVNELNLLKISPNFMDKIEDISIDYALMQKSLNIKMVPLDAGWSDMGSFDELSKKMKSDGEPLQIDASENFVIAKKPTALVDVQNLLVVDTEDALLIAKKGSSQKVKEVYKHFSNSLPEICEAHTSVYRPWGSYEVLGEGNGYKMKKIIVKPGKRLSLQKHFKRNEHWIVVEGEALVTIDSDKTPLKQNESIYIKKEQTHRLENTANTDLIVIEVQTGEYLGEDDIVRISDDYDRK
ncbi:mannose-1-phosphate guanylyltransferase/mannose-6-phosphate isomerase [Campylobacter rectus RM3267]|uniref:mannose-1-phosphate guanylyltransferase n=2 Tax=Campylobacter rectus TaxID=203 RepID=A0A6G5QLI7_CAMRE|nr:mannose-1-phosphate guanylyltransferase/mannose-6-phosphate isomerase [Campylobacter rectus]EEF13268.1 mannose-1-phosphate guanylyltransferase/mannose-6-phosphate isomerase [Campylobacter rectus RM3267]QCD46530.1 bifunctional mannose-6-phosphate isomerase / mannose-1-phosphate guanylyltransferase [Campylobacter rectus]UEB47231.1 mannose-1-phosphate guanylyltransferase/mannose-6-phosphate isomerase [Campylobacter rectus]